jgi:hypothetical protein
MSLLTQKSQLEKDLAEKDESVMRCVEAVHHLAVILNNENDRFWSLPTDRLLALMNNDIQNTQSIFDSNKQISEAVNRSLDEVNDPRFSTRAPTAPGRNDIIFDGAKYTINQ